MFVDRNGQLLGAFAHIVAIHAASEGFVFELAFYGIGLDLEDAFPGFDEGAGGEETGKFVAGK